MKNSKKQKLINNGWKVGDASDLLGLSDEEVRLIETKSALIGMVKEIRQINKITQQKLAEMINSSQSRIAKMEGLSPDVSLDLVFRALFAMGVSQRKVGKVISESCKN